MDYFIGYILLFAIFMLIYPFKNLSFCLLLLIGVFYAYLISAKDIVDEYERFFSVGTDYLAFGIFNSWSVERGWIFGILVAFLNSLDYGYRQLIFCISFSAFIINYLMVRHLSFFVYPPVALLYYWSSLGYALDWIQLRYGLTIAIFWFWFLTGNGPNGVKYRFSKTFLGFGLHNVAILFLPLYYHRLCLLIYNRCVGLLALSFLIHLSGIMGFVLETMPAHISLYSKVTSPSEIGFIKLIFSVGLILFVKVATPSLDVREKTILGATIFFMCIQILLLDFSEISKRIGAFAWVGEVVLISLIFRQIKVGTTSNLGNYSVFCAALLLLAINFVFLERLPVYE